MSAKTSAKQRNFKCAVARRSEAAWLQLIAQDDALTRGHHLVINMKARRQELLPMRNALLFDDQKNPLWIAPVPQNGVLVN